MEGRNYTDKIEELRSQMEEIRQHLVSNPQSNWSTGALDKIKANLNELGATLETERSQFQILVENAPSGMAMIDRDGKFLYINPKFKEMFGYDLKDIPRGREWFRKAYPDPAYRHEVKSA